MSRTAVFLVSRANTTTKMEKKNVGIEMNVRHHVECHMYTGTRQHRQHDNLQPITPTKMCPRRNAFPGSRLDMATAAVLWCFGVLRSAKLMLTKNFADFRCAVESGRAGWRVSGLARAYIERRTEHKKCKRMCAIKV